MTEQSPSSPQERYALKTLDHPAITLTNGQLLSLDVVLSEANGRVLMLESLFSGDLLDTVSKDEKGAILKVFLEAIDRIHEAKTLLTLGDGKGWQDA